MFIPLSTLLLPMAGKLFTLCTSGGGGWCCTTFGGVVCVCAFTVVTKEGSTAAAASLGGELRSLPTFASANCFLGSLSAFLAMSAYEMGASRRCGWPPAEEAAGSECTESTSELSFDFSLGGTEHTDFLRGTVGEEVRRRCCCSDAAEPAASDLGAVALDGLCLVPLRELRRFLVFFFLVTTWKSDEEYSKLEVCCGIR